MIEFHLSYYIPRLNYKFSNTLDSSSQKIFEKQFDSRSFEINELAKTIAVLKMFQDYMPGHGIMVHNAIFWLNKELLGQKKFWVQKFFLGKIVWVKTNFG